MSIVQGIRLHVFLAIIIVVAFLISFSIGEKEMPYPRKYSEAGITLERKNELSALQVSFNETIDCYGDCPSVNRCSIGICFGVCFDKNKDFQISAEELQAAFDLELGIIEKAVAGHAISYIEQFDGADGSPKNGLITPSELQSVRGACKSFAKIHDYLCSRCTRYSSYMERHPSLLKLTGGA